MCFISSSNVTATEVTSLSLVRPLIPILFFSATPPLISQTEERSSVESIYHRLVIDLA